MSETQSSSSFIVGLVRDWAIALGVVVVLLFGYNLLFRPQAPGPGNAPDFTLADLDGNAVALSDQAGVVVLNFWFTSCPPCRAEIPELSRFHEANPSVPMYGVSNDIGMPTERLRSLSERLGIRYPVLHDVRGVVAGQFGIDSFPTTVIIKDGQIINARVGMVDQQWLEAAIGG